MDDVYKRKTRSDEKLGPSQLRPGLIVWVPAPENPANREEHICTGINGSHIPVAEHRRRKAAQAAHNAATCYPSRRRRRLHDRSLHSLAF